MGASVMLMGNCRVGLSKHAYEYTCLPLAYFKLLLYISTLRPS